MFNTFNIGQQVYYVDMLDKPKIVPGVIVGIGISTTGYKLYDIKTKIGVVSKECAFVSDTLKDAEKALANISPIQKEMNAIREKAQAELDAKRKLIIGEPQFKNLLDKETK